MKRWLIALAIAGLGLVACGEEDLAGAPDVRGLPLPEAKTQLENAGYSAAVSDDATFGVIVESHFTVCDEHSPTGRLVPIDVSKDC
jgi:hypothetical protein